MQFFPIENFRPQKFVHGKSGSAQKIVRNESYPPSCRKRIANVCIGRGAFRSVVITVNTLESTNSPEERDGGFGEFRDGGEMGEVWKEPWNKK